MKRIVVGVDRNERSDCAIEAGIRLAERLGATLELVHAVALSQHGWLRTDAAKLAAANAGTLSQAWRHVSSHLQSAFPGAEAGGESLESLLQLLPGPPAKLLIDRVTDPSEDLILLGPHRRRGVVDFGGTARAILAGSPCPVWIQPEAPREIRRILVPIDLSEGSALPLNAGCRLARALGCRLTALHCYEAPHFAYGIFPEHSPPSPAYVLEELREASQGRLEDVLARHDWSGVEHEQLLVQGEPIEQILALQDRVDLVVMGTHGVTRLAAAVLGSVAYAVLRSSRVAVLVVRQDGEGWLVPSTPSTDES